MVQSFDVPRWVTPSKVGTQQALPQLKHLALVALVLQNTGEADVDY
jgi:hypothetical protein